MREMKIFRGLTCIFVLMNPQNLKYKTYDASVNRVNSEIGKIMETNMYIAETLNKMFIQ